MDPQPWPEGSYILGSVCRSIFPSLLSIFLLILLSFCLSRSLSFLGIYILVFSDICYGVIGPSGIVWMFLRKNPRWAKMTKNGHKCPPNDIFSTVLKNFAINFCLNINLPVENPYLGKFLFWSYSWNVIRYISGWNHLISWIVCIWTNYQKRKTSNLIFLIRWPGMLRYVQRSI